MPVLEAASGQPLSIEPAQQGVIPCAQKNPQAISDSEHSVSIKLVKVTRLGFEPRTFWMYPRCSNKLSYPAVSVPVMFSLIPCTFRVPTPCTTYVNLVTAYIGEAQACPIRSFSRPWVICQITNLTVSHILSPFVIPVVERRKLCWWLFRPVSTHDKKGKVPKITTQVLELWYNTLDILCTNGHFSSIWLISQDRVNIT